MVKNFRALIELRCIFPHPGFTWT